MTPTRFQLRRTKGYRKPEGGVVCTRASKWGNPFTIDCYALLHQDSGRWRELAIGDFETALLTRRLEIKPEDVKRELAGKPLGCFCALDAPCHVDVLLKVANG